MPDLSNKRHRVFVYILSLTIISILLGTLAVRYWSHGPKTVVVLCSGYGFLFLSAGVGGGLLAHLLRESKAFVRVMLAAVWAVIIYTVFLAWMYTMVPVSSRYAVSFLLIPPLPVWFTSVGIVVVVTTAVWLLLTIKLKQGRRKRNGHPGLGSSSADPEE